MRIFGETPKMGHITSFLLGSSLRWEWKSIIRIIPIANRIGFPCDIGRCHAGPRALLQRKDLHRFLRFLASCNSVCSLRSINCKVPIITETLVFHWFYKGLLNTMFFQLITRFPASSDWRTLSKCLILQGFSWFLAWSSSACSLRSVNCKVPTITEKLGFYWFYKGLLKTMFFPINCKVSRSADLLVL